MTSGGFLSFVGSRRERLAVVAFALACAASTFVCIKSAPVPYYNDAMIYLSLGEHLARGDGYHSSLFVFHDLIQPPLFPMAIALGTLITSPLNAAIAIAMMSWALTALALVRIHSLVWGSRGAWVVAGSVAFFPMLAISSLITAEPMFVCLITWGVSFAFSAVTTGRLRDTALAAMFVGLSILTRPEGILTAVVIAGLAACSRTDLRQRLQRLVVTVAIIAILVVPYGLFIRSQLGYFTIVPKIVYNQPYQDVLARFDWPEDQKEIQSRDQRPGATLMPDHENFVFTYKFTHPDADITPLFPLKKNSGGALHRVGDILGAARKIVWATVRAFGVWNPLAALFILFALVRGVRRRGDPKEQPRRELVVALVALVLIHLAPAMSSADNFEHRFLSASTFLSLALLGGGVAPLSDVARRWLGRMAWAPSALLVATYCLLLTTTVSRVAGPTEKRRRVQELGEKCVEEIPRGQRVLALNARCSFLTGGTYFGLPYVESLADLEEYVAKHKVDYAVLDADTLGRHPSSVLRSLADPKNWPAGWHLQKRLATDPPNWIIKIESQSAAQPLVSP